LNHVYPPQKLIEFGPEIKLSQYRKATFSVYFSEAGKKFHADITLEVREPENNGISIVVFAAFALLN